MGATLGAATGAAAEPAKPLFAGDDMLHLTITAPIARLKTARTAADVFDGTIAVTGANAETVPVKLTARGVTRRRTDICPFPPLRVEFAQKPAETSLFVGQKKLKLVTHCRTAADFQSYPLLEYAAYRLYNTLTPQSFRVRLASIDYVDGGKTVVSRIGFFVEDAGDVAKRNDLHQLKLGDRVPSATLDPASTARFSVFEYMIGNLDWATNAGAAGTDCCHNARLIGAKDAATGRIPLPYDFDFSGLVDAPYAEPPDAVPVANVRIRRYRGFCRHNNEAQTAAADMLARREPLLAVLDGVPGLDERAKKKAQAYLGSFFDKIATPQDVTANLLATCL